MLALCRALPARRPLGSPSLAHKQVRLKVVMSRPAWLRKREPLCRAGRFRSRSGNRSSPAGIPIGRTQAIQGCPPTIEWALPRDFRAGPIVWPTPKRLAYGPVVDYGYENETSAPGDHRRAVEPRSGRRRRTLGSCKLAGLLGYLCPRRRRAENFPPGRREQAEPDPYWAERFAANRAHLPVPNPFPTTVALVDEQNHASCRRPATPVGSATLMFFPADADVIDDDAAQTVTAAPEGLTLELARARAQSRRPPCSRVFLSSMIRLRKPKRNRKRSRFRPRLSRRRRMQLLGSDLSGPLALAFAGGILLNLMPCVLPVLSIKVFGLVQHAQSAPREVRLQGAAYTAGVLVSFALIAAGADRVSRCRR